MLTEGRWDTFRQNLFLFFQNSSYNGEAEETGDYKICLDNKVSTWSDKTVWFEVQVEDPEDDYDDDYMGKKDTYSDDLILPLVLQILRSGKL